MRKKRILECLKRVRLPVVEVGGLSGKKKTEVAAGRVSRVELLAELTRDELKTVCRAAGLDDSSRANQTLIDRICGMSPATKKVWSGLPASGKNVDNALNASKEDDCEEEIERKGHRAIRPCGQDEGEQSAGGAGHAGDRPAAGQKEDIPVRSGTKRNFLDEWGREVNTHGAMASGRGMFHSIPLTLKRFSSSTQPPVRSRLRRSRVPYPRGPQRSR